MTDHRCDSHRCPRCGHFNRVQHLLDRIDVVGRLLREPPEFLDLIERSGCPGTSSDDLAFLIEELVAEFRRSGSPAVWEQFEQWKASV